MENIYPCVSLTALRQTLGDFEGGDIDLTVDLKGLTTKAGDLTGEVLWNQTFFGVDKLRKNINF